MDGALAERVRRSAATDEPLDLVVAAVRLADGLAADADEVVVHFVEAARRAGCPWTDIGGRMGVSKQAARKRWASAVDSKLPPLRPRLQRCLEQADEEARLDGSTEVTTLHLLLGLQREGVAASALRSLNVSDDRLRPAVRARLGAAGLASDEPPPRSAELTCALEAAAQLARQSLTQSQAR